MKPAAFFAIMIPFCLLGGLLLLGVNRLIGRGEAYRTEAGSFSVRNKKLLTAAAALFVLNILSVFRAVDFRLAFLLTAAAFLILAPRLFRGVDYCLLMTFVLFFLFTDSVAGMPAVEAALRGMLRSKTAVLLVSAGLSQVIGNVPAAVLVSGFTQHARELLYGVSAGGLGTLVASLASLISYQLYSREYRTGKYLKLFHLLNFGMLFVFLLAFLIFGRG
jgi:hypothetical protein